MVVTVLFPTSVEVAVSPAPIEIAKVFGCRRITIPEPPDV
jgi:hypothetical protein